MQRIEADALNELHAALIALNTQVTHAKAFLSIPNTNGRLGSLAKYQHAAGCEAEKRCPPGRMGFAVLRAGRANNSRSMGLPANIAVL
eukprot:scaffold194191_cov46-Prasinocladus_malaysianus.AAC.2